MSDLDFDPELFGLWPKAPVYDGLRPRGGMADETLEALAERVILDTKAQARGSLEDLQDMLNSMPRELREQMQQFQRLRLMADEKAEAAGEEIDRKTIQADAKASIEAMSVIVRTLEKIDSLQRTIAHDRQAEADAAFDEAKYQAFLAEVDLRVEQRAKQLHAKQAADAARNGVAAGPDDPSGRSNLQGAPPGSAGGEGGSASS